MPKVKPLTAVKTSYGNLHCFDHVAFMRDKGREAVCGGCGHRFKVEVPGKRKIRCPHCGITLDTKTNHRTAYRDKSYYMVHDTAGRFQVLRWFLFETVQRAGQSAFYGNYEVSQTWFAPDGKKVRVERVRSCSHYLDSFSRYSSLDIRQGTESVLDSIIPYATYGRPKIIPELKRRGFTGDSHGIAPVILAETLLSDGKAETILKARQYDLLRHLIVSHTPTAYYWPSIRIAIRHCYMVKDASMWIDFLSDLRSLGKDMTNPHYVCPDNLTEAHARYSMLAYKHRFEIQERERREERKQWNAKYLEMKKAFFGIAITDGEITLNVLRSVDEFESEGSAMHHCVFQNAYYKNKHALILSATMAGKRIETVEVSLKTFKVVQSRGVCNSNTEYHDRIIALVEKNMEKIRRCARKAA